MKRFPNLKLDECNARGAFHRLAMTADAVNIERGHPSHARHQSASGEHLAQGIMARRAGDFLNPQRNEGRRYEKSR